ncbi:uncharacterized protein PADG_11838 [Paracoccidioides brasiliensis Pb18]|uniref:Uncharacterized protein n=1 Tax=Paracoccidioides brasiliensis (strain Pb18) TaxID=502780 RepID=A0A0A0HTS4_PARBD|nr:uncharacterized protein PADG_11838 [Paracoccidioides brasiliensis Pb18]KGM92047.1 hypothetical protein PADG_11838 [Paracoccidioides brasiliensis Pb18]
MRSAVKFGNLIMTGGDICSESGGCDESGLEEACRKSAVTVAVFSDRVELRLVTRGEPSYGESRADEVLGAELVEMEVGIGSILASSAITIECHHMQPPRSQFDCNPAKFPGSTTEYSSCRLPCYPPSEEATKDELCPIISVGMKR